MRRLGAYFNASQALFISCSLALASPAIVAPCTSAAILCTASKSPGEATGKPASMMSTPSFTSCRASCSFSSTFIEAPGDCSPSLNVVSNILMVLMRIVLLFGTIFLQLCRKHHSPSLDQKVDVLNYTPNKV